MIKGITMSHKKGSKVKKRKKLEWKGKKEEQGRK